MPVKRDSGIVRARVLGISGSPRRGGNSDTLLDKALEGASSVGAVTEKIFLNSMDFRPCQACGGCNETGACMIPDDMRRVYKSIERADAVIVASPVYFGNVTAQLKAMIDRFQSAWIARYALKNSPGRTGRAKGYFLCTSGSRDRKSFLNSASVVRNFFSTIGIRYSGDVYFAGSDRKCAVKGHPRTMSAALKLGRLSAK